MQETIGLHFPTNLSEIGHSYFFSFCKRKLSCSWVNLLQLAITEILDHSETLLTSIFQILEKLNTMSPRITDFSKISSDC